MRVFKKVINSINRTIAPMCFGFGVQRLFSGDYKLAAWFLFVTSILFAVGYFVERCSK